MTPRNILVLDDDTFRLDAFSRWYAETDKVTLVKSVEEACQQLLNQVFDLVFLDHDLGDVTQDPYPRERTGMDVAIFISNLPREQRPGRVIVHSVNVMGAIRMVRELVTNAGVAASPIPFPELVKANAALTPQS